MRKRLWFISPAQPINNNTATRAFNVHEIQKRVFKTSKNNFPPKIAKSEHSVTPGS